MPTLSDIITSIKDGNKPDYEDLLYAVLALDGLLSFATHDFLELGFGEPSPFKTAEFVANEHFNRCKIAFGVAPKKYIGQTFDPANPEYQAQRAVFKKIADKFEEECTDE